MGTSSGARRQQVTKGNKQHVRCLGNLLILLLLIMSISSVDSGPLHVKPEVDLNLATEANRILYVLNKVIERAQFAGLLKHFLKRDAELLQDVLDSNTITEIVRKSEKYCNVIPLRPSSSSDYYGPSTHSLGRNANADTSSTGVNYDDDEPDDDSPSLSIYTTSSSSNVAETKTKRKDDALTEVIYLLEENQEVKKMAENMKNMLSSEMKFFIKSLIEFKNRMQKRLNENATQYKTRENYMRETYEKNERAKKEIERLEEELLVTKTDANVCLIGRNILIKRHQQKISKIKQDSLEAIEKRVNESEKAMVNNWKLSSAKQDNLKQDFLQASDKYANLLRDHLATEKVLRGKRAKVENQVLGWIQKFDQDIGEKQAEEEEIQARLDKETEELNEIQSKLDEQEEEYDELMQEKAAYEEEMLERRLYQFIMNRSARRIQRTYRSYKARKLAKKLAKKSKKGKKKEKGKEK